MLAKHTLSNSECVIAVGDSLIPTVSGDQIQYSVQGTLLKSLQLRWDTGRISERAEESFNRQSVPTVVSKEVGSVSFRLTKISYSFILRKGNTRFSLPPFMEIPSPFRRVHCPKESFHRLNRAISDIYSKSTAIIQAMNGVSSAIATLTITSYSLPLFISVIVLYHLHWKSQLPVRRLEEDG